MRTEQWWNDNDRRKPKYWDKKLSHYNLSTTNPTWTRTRTNLDLCNEKPAACAISFEHKS